MMHLWNNGILMIWQRSKPALEFMIIEGHDVEKESQMVDAMQSSQVWAAYLNSCLCDRRQACQDCPGVMLMNRPFLSTRSLS